MRFDIDAVVLDLDGTLVDSVPDLALAVDAMMADLGMPARGQQRVRDWVGNGVSRLVKRALTLSMEEEPSTDLMARALPLFEHHYAANLCVRSQLYPGVREGLEQLRAEGYRLACATNKATAFAVPLLEQLQLAEFFLVTLGGDATQRRKPAPDALLLVAKRLQVAPARMLMVGDSVNDVGAARQAGCPVVCVPYGYNHGQDIADASPDAVVPSIAAIPTLLKQAA